MSKRNSRYGKERREWQPMLDRKVVEEYVLETLKETNSPIPKIH
ncbi:MAG: hypothetical protein ABSD42_14255 [Candidatus Bathyarchaeia archaeon]|jgi:hypothetical protein